MEEQKAIVPTSIVYSVYAAFLNGLSNEDAYDSLAIPYEYMDAIDAMWENWEEEERLNPTPPNVSKTIPSEFYF